MPKSNSKVTIFYYYRNAPKCEIAMNLDLYFLKCYAKIQKAPCIQNAARDTHTHINGVTLFLIQPILSLSFSRSRLYSLDLCPCSLFGAIKRCKIQTCDFDRQWKCAVHLYIQTYIERSVYECNIESFGIIIIIAVHSSICVSFAINDGMLYTVHTLIESVSNL